jgi:hypothetical protein
MLLALGACDTGRECGPFEDKFKTTGFVTATYKLENGYALDGEPLLTPIEGDTLAQGEFSIKMTPTQAFYFSEASTGPAFGFVRSVYACSPPIPSSDEVITDIQVYSDAAFTDAYPAGENLAPLFDAVVLNQASHLYYHRIDLNDFLSGQPHAADEVVLILKAAPARTTDFTFTVRYFQEGAGLDSYAFKTAPVVLEAK